MDKDYAVVVGFAFNLKIIYFAYMCTHSIIRVLLGVEMLGCKLISNTGF